MHYFKTLLTVSLLLFSSLVLLAQQSPLEEFKESKRRRQAYLHFLDDAQLDIGVRMVGIFALDDRAPLSANPHFRAMLNLIRLGAKLESLLQGADEPLNDMDFGKEFGLNGYNKTIFSFFIRYGFGESSDFEIQRHFLELAVSPGYFKEGNGGMNLHLDYLLNIAKTNYGAGVQSIQRAFDYEFYTGARIGFDWSSRRSENETGFFSHLSDELNRIAFDQEFTAAQLIMLQDLAESSRVLLPNDVGGRAFHVGPLAGIRVSKRLFGSGRLFLEGQGFYDLLDLVGDSRQRENSRSQHHISAMLGFSLTLGSRGEVLDFF